MCCAFIFCSFLDEIGSSGETAHEYITLYKSLLNQAHWKHYLALRGVLGRIGRLLNDEIDKLTELEETSLSSDLSLGFALRAYTGWKITTTVSQANKLHDVTVAELLTMFASEDNIKRHYKRHLVRVVLGGYLSLRRLIVQRTKLIDDAEEKLQVLLEDLTTGA